MPVKALRIGEFYRSGTLSPRLTDSQRDHCFASMVLICNLHRPPISLFSCFQSGTLSSALITTGRGTDNWEPPPQSRLLKLFELSNHKSVLLASVILFCITEIKAPACKFPPPPLLSHLGASLLWPCTCIVQYLHFQRIVSIIKTSSFRQSFLCLFVLLSCSKISAIQFLEQLCFVDLLSFSTILNRLFTNIFF